MSDQYLPRHYIVTRNGKLIKRIQCILDHYRELGLDVESVLEREKEKLASKLLVDEILRYNTVSTNELNNYRAKIRAIREILAVINS